MYEPIGQLYMNEFNSCIHSIFPTRINKAILFILLFWFLAPVRCLVFPALFFLVTFFFCLVHGLRIVFGGGIDRI